MSDARRIDTSHLRELAEALGGGEWLEVDPDDDSSIVEFDNALTPGVVLALLDVVEAAQNDGPRACWTMPEKVAYPVDQVPKCGECPPCRLNAALAGLNGDEG